MTAYGLVTTNDYSNVTTKNNENEQDQNLVYITLSTTIGLIGAIGNFGVLMILGSSRRLRNKLVNICLMNQSAIDLAASIFLMISWTQDVRTEIRKTGICVLFMTTYHKCKKYLKR